MIAVARPWLALSPRWHHCYREGSHYRAVGVLPLDLLVRTAEQLDERLAIGDGFVRGILERGKVLYEADHA